MVKSVRGQRKVPLGSRNRIRRAPDLGQGGEKLSHRYTMGCTSYGGRNFVLGGLGSGSNIRTRVRCGRAFYHPGTPVGVSSGYDIFWDFLDFCIVGPRSGISVAPLAYKESEAISERHPLGKAYRGRKV